MKKILILAYDFPPYVSVGALRPNSWFDYFQEFGLYPIVVTRQWENKFGDERDYVSPSNSTETIVEKFSRGVLLKTPYKPNLANRIFLRYGSHRFRVYRKLTTGFYELMQFFFHIGPRSRLLKEADQFLNKNTVDFILATGDPFILFKYAHDLGNKFSIPYLLDYRDLWSQDIANRDRPGFKLFYKYFERKYLKKACAVVTVSNYLASNIKSLVPTGKIFISPNGFETSLYKYSQNNYKQLGNNFSIVYAGTIYNWHPIEQFLNCFAEFCNEQGSAEAKITFIGVNKSVEIKEIICKSGLSTKHYEFLPKMSPKLLAEKLLKSDLLLLFNDYNFMGTKIYDYLGANKKIIFCFANDNESNKLRLKFFPEPIHTCTNDTLQQDLIKKTNGGIIVENQKDLIKQLKILYLTWLKNGFVPNQNIGVEIYSRKNQVQLLASYIHEL